MKFKRLLVTLSLLTVTSLSLAQPAMAANPFETFASSVKARINRLYLQLPGDKPANAVLSQSVAAMNNLKSAQTDLDVNVVVKDQQDQEAMTAKISMAGPTEIKDVYDPTTAKQDLKMTGELTMQGTTLKADVDLKFDGETIYFNAHQLPAMPYFDLSKIQNQWLKVTPASESAARRRERRELTVEMRQEMEKAFNELVAKSQLSPARKEKLDGNGVFAIEIAMPDSALIEYFDKIAEIEGIEAEERAQGHDSTQKALDAMADLKVKVWIDRGNFFVRKFEVPMDFDIQKFMASAETETKPLNSGNPFASIEEMKTLTIAVIGTMDDYNQPVSFEVPADARDFQEVMTEIMSQIGGPAIGSGAVQLEMNKGQQMKLQTMPKIPASELKNLSPEERKILQQYGIDPDNL